jgi:hypothetical protein
MRGLDRMKNKLGLGLLLLTICTGAFAAEGAKKLPNTKGNKAVSLPPTLVFNRKLVSTSFVLGEADVTIPVGTLTAVDSPLKFTCPTGGCTVTASLNLQLSGGGSGNAWGMCPELDGNVMPPGSCPFIGDLPADGDYMAGSFRFAQSGLKAGNHTLQSFVAIAEGGFLATYEITYSLYTP